MSQDAPRRGRISPLMGLLLAGAAVALLVPLVLFVQGLGRGDRGLITTAGVWWGVTLGLVLALPTSAEQALRDATGRGALVTTLLRFLEVILAALLPACLLLALLPSTTSRSTLTLLALAGFVVVAWGAWSFRRRFIGMVGSLVFAGLIAQIAFPDTSARFIERLERWDTQPHVERITLEDIERGRVAFFADGEPVLWYHL
ncbi:MAG TPA: hypothetical protein VK610_01240, partial [Rhodothermales bacterium]|nr:hypothetical protein [Rhodothermales bacterium]